MHRMKKIAGILAASVLLSAFAAHVSGCFLLPKYNDPKSIEIGGETFVSGFYENLWPDGIVFHESDPPDLETKYHFWWEVKNAPFVMYCAQNKEALYWDPAIYCKKSEFDAAYQYYADSEHFDYYIGLYGDSNEDGHVRLGVDADRELLERAVSLNMQIDAEQGKGLFDQKGDWSEIQAGIPFEDCLSVQPVVYRVSKDGYFTTIRNAWIVTRDGIYISGIYDAEAEEYAAYSVGEACSDYLMRLLTENGFFS